ncbi:uncharacterized protein LOC141712003 [Apium graveolens]|uniref:uncharacterized protein LOC141712003 n=1 Tax=Apium graveolens TaxID=4045 RepID=UPI003D7BCA13
MDGMDVEKPLGMGDLFDDRVKEYVFSGSNIPEADKLVLEQNIEEKEKQQMNKRFKEVSVCGLNKAKDYFSDPDESDLFMMQGIVQDQEKETFWNVRGFNNPLKRKEVVNLIIDNQVGLCALIETHVARGRVKNIFDRLFRSWDWISNSAYCRRGCKIVVGWNPALFDVVEIISTDQVMHCVVTDLESNYTFHCSIVYAANEHVNRREVWHSLRSYSMLTTTSPLIVMGDFNAILSSSEMQGGVESRSPAIQEFRDCVNFIEVQDIVYSGIHFTWAGSPHGVGVVKKLDRVMANLNFLNKFVGSSVNFLPRGVSDHSPAMVNLMLCRKRGKSSFKFNNFLAYRENFLDLVSGVWKQRVGGVKMYQVTQKLHSMKRIFKAESWKGGDLSTRGDVLKAKLVDVKTQLDSFPLDEELQKREQSIAREYMTCKLEEESLLKQRAKVHWLKVGDQNSKFFHKSLQARRHKKPFLRFLMKRVTCCKEKV